jgi:hydrogenase maturation protease
MAQTDDACRAETVGAQNEGVRLLLIGYGNMSRRDDGVAFHVLERLRQRLGLPSSSADAEEAVWIEDRLSIMQLHQLTPELAEELVQYSDVVFIDAHVEGVDWEPVHWQSISPAYRSSMVSHHLNPTSLLALCETLYGCHPAGYVLSVLGIDFDFGDQLSPETSARADRAVLRLIEFVRAKGLITQADAP